MVRKKLDERIRTLLQHSLRTNQRSLLLLVGDHGKDQVPNLHQIMQRTADQSKTERISQLSANSVLWCYKKELGFSTHRKKRMEKLKRDKKRGLAKQNAGGGGGATDRMDNFELFLTNSDITWCYYKDSHRVLGTTHSMLVLQDFEALTPNIMARTVETVRGGGLVVFLLRTVKSLRQLYAMTMDVHSRYRTEGSGEVLTPRFNERFILSLANCRNCLVCDDELNILPLSRRTLNRLTEMGLESNGGGGEEEEEGGKKKKKKKRKSDDNEDVLSFRTEDDLQLENLKETLRDTPHVGKLVELTRTLDQARAVLTFLEACADRDKPQNSPSSPLAGALNGKSTTVVSLTAARGRGKSAALGLCLAGAISFGFNSVAVTAPEPENLVSVFQFLVEGLKALKYQEHYDYTLGYNYGGVDSDDGYAGGNRGEKAGRDNTKCIISVTVHSQAKGGRQQKRQTVRYIRPRDMEKFSGAELVAIDEAAAIPLPVVRGLMRLKSNHGGKANAGGGGGDDGEQRRLTFLSSTINGYEGTGRALSLKLIKELRDSNAAKNGRGASAAADAARAAGEEIAGAASKKGEAKVHERRWAAEAAAAKDASAPSASGSPSLKELELSHPIRYALGDPVEAWLNGLLCLDCDSFDMESNTLKIKDGGSPAADSNMELTGGAPSPAECELYGVDRDALFSYHRLSESFLQKLWGLYTSAHYKNAPNDLQMLSDAPAHNLFVLLGPTAEGDSDRKGDAALPDILAIVQTSLEGKLSRKTVQAQLARGHRSAGDLIPWTMSQQFGDGNFAQLSGARVVRVAVHPAVQGMGYGSRAMELLYRYYNGEMVSLDGGGMSDDEDEGSDDETPSESDSDEEPAASDALLHKESPKPRKKLPPLLLPLASLPAPRLDWLGTSFGLTPALHSFWSSRAGMTLLYLRQTANELTGEHSAIMIRALPRRSGWDDAWLPAFGADSRRRIGRLLGGAFRGMEVRLAVSLLGDTVANMNDSKRVKDPAALREMRRRSGSESPRLAPAELRCHLTSHDLQRLELYGRNLCDHHLVSDLVPSLATLYFTGRMAGWGNDGGEFRLSQVQSALLCGMGLQRKGADELAQELALPINQVLAMFNKAVKKMSTAFNNLLAEEEAGDLLPGRGKGGMKEAEAKVRRIRDVVGQTLEEEEAEGAAVAMEALEKGQQEVEQGQQQKEKQQKKTKNAGSKDSGVTGTRLPAEIKDPEIMKYALKGTDEEWANALEEKGGVDALGDGGTVQIKSTKVKTPKKRKAENGGDDVMESVLKNEKNIASGRKKKDKKSKSKSKKSRKTM